MARLITENGRSFIRDEWGTEDIQSVADCNFDMVLTEKQILKVMEIAVEEYDADVGINWDTFDAIIEDVLFEPGATE